MQAYQSAPCPYCGVTWNPPGAQACGNCRNALPPPQPSYPPPGYAPGQQPQPPYQGGPPPGYPQQGQGQPYPPQYPQQGQGQPYPPQAYPQQGQGQQYPTQGYPQQGQGQPYPPPGYPPYPYAEQPGYPVDPYGGQAYPGQPYPGQYGGYPPGAAPADGGRTLMLMGRSITLPFPLPAGLHGALSRIAGTKVIVVAGVAVAALLLVFAILPAVATGQISGAGQAIGAAAAHQHNVDAAMALFLKPSGPVQSDPTLEKAAINKDLVTVQAALVTVQADEAAISSFDQHLAWVSIAALPRRQAIAAERVRTTAAISALKQADQVLSAAVNQARLSLPLVDAFADYAKMGAAMARHDLVGAGAPYPDAQQKLEQAAQVAVASGIAPSTAKEVRTFTDLVNNYEQMIQAVQNKDAAAVQKYSALVQAGLKDMNAFTAGELDAWNTKMFAPLVKGYDAGLKTATKA
jgi:hypothetical protein